MARAQAPVLKWKGDDYTGVYVARADDGTYFSISNEQGGWIVWEGTVAPDLEAYPMKLGRRYSGFAYATLSDAKSVILYLEQERRTMRIEVSGDATGFDLIGVSEHGRSYLARAQESAVSGRGLGTRLAASYNAVRDALALYDDPHKSITSETANQMADILRAALNGGGGDEQT